MDGLPPTTLIDEALPSTQMDELLLYTLTSPSLQLRWTGSHLQLILTSSSPNPDGRAPAIHSDEPFAATQMDGNPPTTNIDELFPQPRWTSSAIHSDEPYPETQMDGLPPTTLIDEAIPSTQMDKLLLYTLKSPSMQLRLTGSHLQLILTSSSLNPDGRPSTIHTDEPFAATQMDGLPRTTHIDELFPQPRWTNSYYSH